MATTTTPTVPKTLLEAVNELLRAIRKASVMSLSASDRNEAASGAKQALDAASVEVQTLGWEFNTVLAAVIDPTPSGEIELPSNCLKVRTARTSSGERLVQRGQRLYSRKNRTYNIGEAVTVDMVEALEFSELSSSFRLWVTALAAIRFCQPQLPSGATFQYTQDFLEAARAAAELEDATVEDTPLSGTSPHFRDMARR